MPILIPSIQRTGMNRGAFGTKLTCPALVTGLSNKPEICNASRWEFVEQIGMYRVRYRCKACHKTIVYDYSGNPGHPYEVYGKNKWQRIVQRWKDKNKGKHPVGI
jgi:transposase-like protein